MDDHSGGPTPGTPGEGIFTRVAAVAAVCGAILAFLTLVLPAARLVFAGGLIGFALGMGTLTFVRWGQRGQITSSPGKQSLFLISVIGCIGLVLLSAPLFMMVPGGSQVTAPNLASTSNPSTAATPLPSATLSAGGPTPTTGPSATATGGGGGGPTVRRTTGASPLTLSYSYYADLDSNAPDWGVVYGSSAGTDVGNCTDATICAPGNSDVGPVTGPASYSTCANATSYTKRLTVHADDELCVRTTDGRHAFVHVRSVTTNGGPTTLDVTVWNGQA
jgi:hypothetical protein